MRLLLTAMLGALGFSAAAAPGAISGDNVNMRRAPARTAEVVMKLNRDLPVEILSTENGWVKIGIRDAYVHTDYLKDGKVAAKTNLRVGPGTETARLGALSDARECQELGRQGKWAHVRFREPVVEGYVSESLVKAGAAPAAATTKPDTPPAAASTIFYHVVLYLFMSMSASVIWGGRKGAQGVEPGSVCLLLKRDSGMNQPCNPARAS